MGLINFFDSKECEWADVTVSVAGSTVTKVTGIKYGVKAEKEHLYGAGDEPISIQSGNRAPTGTLTLLKGAFDAIHAAALAAGGRDVTDLQFDIVVFYKPRGTRPPQTDVLQNCEVSDFEKGMMQNDKSMPINLPFLFLRLAQS